MLSELVIRPAVPADRGALGSLIESAPYIHRHLDWRAPLDWLGTQPFWLAENRQRTLLAALACPPDPAGVAWIRLFMARENRDLGKLWLALFEQARLQTEGSQLLFAGIALHTWFTTLLQQTRFHRRQEIVVLEWNGNPHPLRPRQMGLSIRPMLPVDLPQVAEVDRRAFDLLWQNSLDGLLLAFDQSAYSSVAVCDGEIVGYQISTAMPYSAHLARLAVLPERQHQSIGYQLVADLLERFWQGDMLRVTVNTQGDNDRSLALYQKLGFTPTGDTFDVYVYP